MPALSSGDQSTIRGTYSLRRYLSVAPRTSVFTAVVSSVTRDADTNGIVAIVYSSGSGTLSNVLPGYTIDVGTSAGARDVGVLRVRKAPISGTLYVAETAPGEVNVQAGQHLTVVIERRPWAKLSHIVQSASSGSPFNDTFVEYADYDIEYSNENAAIQPVVIIEESAGIPAKPAGFVASGQTYRDVTLTCASSYDWIGTTTITWNLNGGTYQSGSASSASIVARFDISTGVFRYISCTLENSLGNNATLYLPIWVHNDANPPIVDFVPTRDERSDNSGREMAFDLFGVDGSGATIRQGGAICYWEVAEFDGGSTPSQYVSQFYGWAMRDAVRLRAFDRSRYLLDVGGIASWMEKFRAGPRTLTDAGTVPQTWYQMQDITIDKAAHYALRMGSNVLELSNFYRTGVSDTLKGITLATGSLWSQIATIARNCRYATCAADSINGIWLRPNYSYLDDSERAARPTTRTITPEDWTDGSPPEVGEEKTGQIGQIIGNGVAVINGAQAAFGSKAPGIVPAGNNGAEDAPGQVLPASDAQGRLNRLTGHRFADRNSLYPDVSIRLRGNQDVIEPAWGEPVDLTYTLGNLVDLSLSAVKHQVRRVTVQHRNDPQQPKVITVVLRRVTKGNPGDAFAAITSRTTPSRNPRSAHPRSTTRARNTTPNASGLNGTGTAAAFCTDGNLYRTTNYNSVPVWTALLLSTLGMAGTLISFIVDAFSPKYLTGSGAVNGWIVTTSEVRRINDIFGAVTLGAATAHGGSVFGNIIPIRTERGVQNFVAFATYLSLLNTKLWYTTDGTNWSSYQFPGSGTFGGFPSLHITTDGRLYVTAYGTPGLIRTIRLNTDQLATTTFSDTGWSFGVGDMIVTSLTASIVDESRYWYGIRTTFNGDWRLYRNGVDVSPTINGTPRGVDPGVNFATRQIVVADTNANVVLARLVDQASALNPVLGMTRDGGISWSILQENTPYFNFYNSGDDSTYEALGGNGAIAHIEGDLIISKTGNIVTTGAMVGLCGG